jgi:cytochrome b561
MPTGIALGDEMHVRAINNAINENADKAELDKVYQTRSTRAEHLARYAFKKAIPLQGVALTISIAFYVKPALLRVSPKRI